MKAELIAKDYIVGVDAGGTHVRAVAYAAADGRVLSRAEAPQGNLALDFAGAAAHICEAIEAVVTACGALPRLIGVGCAGADTGDNRERLVALLGASFPCPIRVMSDAALSYMAAHGRGDGLLIIAGTGSIAYRRQGDVLRRSGGWGHLIGDGGSGYDIVLRAVRHVTALHDRALPADTLQRALFGALGIDALPALISWMYRASKGEIAALCPVVVACAKDGCAAAQDILRQAGEALADTVRCLFDGERSDKPIRVALSGSVLCRVEAVREAMLSSLGTAGISLRLLPMMPEPTYGAYRLYAEGE